MATDLTIHNLDEDLVSRLREEAQRRGVAVDALVAQVIQEKLPPPEAFNGTVQRDVTGLAGVWTDEDAREFFEAIKDLEQVDEELWK
jgi:hypothetical protein